MKATCRPESCCKRSSSAAASSCKQASDWKLTTRPLLRNGYFNLFNTHIPTLCSVCCMWKSCRSSTAKTSRQSHHLAAFLQPGKSHGRIQHAATELVSILGSGFPDGPLISNGPNLPGKGPGFGEMLGQLNAGNLQQKQSETHQP